MTPAENPSMTSSNLSDTFFVNNTGKDPTPVANPAARLATDPSRIISSIIFCPQILVATIGDKKRGMGGFT